MLSHGDEDFARIKGQSMQSRY
ncbi:unnamed protein product, partial [Didymodactylos carnosus]